MSVVLLLLLADKRRLLVHLSLFALLYPEVMSYGNVGKLLSSMDIPIPAATGLAQPTEDMETIIG